MKFHLGKIWRALPILLLLSGTVPVLSQTESGLSAEEIIQKAVARAQQTENASGLPEIVYTKCSVTEELDDSGKVKERKEKVYEVSFRDGASRVNLLEVNGRTPTADDRKKQTENEMNLRQILGQSKTGKNDTRENFLTPDLAARFDFKLIGQVEVNGRAAYQVSFSPKNPEAPEHKLADRLLNRISGILWIDAQEFEIARADVSLRSEVNLLGGIAGTLKKLAYTLVRTRVADGLWMSTLSSGDFQGRKLLDSTHIKTKSESLNFRRVAMTGEDKGPAS